jgi:hypothetical protein
MKGFLFVDALQRGQQHILFEERHVTAAPAISSQARFAVVVNQRHFVLVALVPKE